MHENLKKYLDKSKKLVSPLVFSNLECEPFEYKEMICEYPRRMGKYLRPALVLLSTELYGWKAKDALQVAAAMQLSEEWMLVHDDAEDKSSERRSTEEEYKPSMNRSLGWEMAINIGDTLHAIMWKAVGDAIKQTGNWKIYDKMYDIIVRTTEGQYQELDWIRSYNIDIKEDEYYQMIDKKTAYYTIIGPIELGGIIAGISTNQSKAITKFGRPLGRLFQIKDDIINLVSDSTTAGKERYSDITEGKRTLITIDLLKKCSYIEREFIKTIYRLEPKNKRKEEIDYIVKAIYKYNCIEHALAISSMYAAEAKREFLKYCELYNIKNKEVKGIFLELVDFLEKRVN